MMVTIRTWGLQVTRKDIVDTAGYCVLFFERSTSCTYLRALMSSTTIETTTNGASI
jgi:hypothetical protein